MRFTLFFAIVCLTLLQSCKTQQLNLRQQSSANEKSPSEKLADLFQSYQNDNQLFSGLMIVDAKSNQVLFSQNENKFFTPASNTKLFTLLAAQYYLSDSIPALQYFEQGDSLVIKGTGDPTFLTKNDVDSVAFHFLNQTNKTIYLNDSRLTTGRFGSGWAWDDYPYYYQKENSAFPIAGQATRITYHPDSTEIKICPWFMQRFINTDSTAQQYLSRAEHSNMITIIRSINQPILEIMKYLFTKIQVLKYQYLINY